MSGAAMMYPRCVPEDECLCSWLWPGAGHPPWTDSEPETALSETAGVKLLRNGFSSFAHANTRPYLAALIVLAY